MDVGRSCLYHPNLLFFLHYFPKLLENSQWLMMERMRSVNLNISYLEAMLFSFIFLNFAERSLEENVKTYLFFARRVFSQNPEGKDDTHQKSKPASCLRFLTKVMIGCNLNNKLKEAGLINERR